MRLSNGQDIVLDPMTYLGRVTRGDDGRVETLEVIYDDQTVHIEDGDEFVTFTTVVLLEDRQNH